jgi:glutathione S-transferase
MSRRYKQPWLVQRPMPRITAFADSPDEGQGLARDMRVRWALEEVGQPYEVGLVSIKALKEPSHRKLNPFGQIPTWQEGDLTLFESGAIILYIANTHSGLLPDSSPVRERGIMWMFAALNTVEPPIVEHEIASYFERDKPWADEHRAMVEKRVHDRLRALSEWLGERSWLEDAFSAGDLMMVMVLRRLEGTDLVAHYPNLAAYVARGQARPAYGRAFADQKAVFDASTKGN